MNQRSLRLAKQELPKPARPPKFLGTRPCSAEWVELRCQCTPPLCHEIRHRKPNRSHRRSRGCWRTARGTRTTEFTSSNSSSRPVKGLMSRSFARSGNGLLIVTMCSRRRFTSRNTPPVQRVHERIEYELEEWDWRRPASRRERSAGRVHARGPASRVAPGSRAARRLNLFRLADQEYRLVWTSHHVLLDGRSRLLLLEELCALYDASRRGERHRLDSPRRYRDHIRWLTGRDFTSSQGDTWTNCCAFFTPDAIARAAGGTATAADLDRHGTVEFRLTNEVTRALANLADELDVTPNTILQGAWCSSWVCMRRPTMWSLAPRWPAGDLR